MYVKQLPSGSWRAIAQVDGRRASGTARTKREAELLHAQLVVDLGGRPERPQVTVGELLDIHLAEHTYRPTTLDDMTRVRKRLPEPFLARNVADVEPVIIDALYRQLTREGWSAHRVVRANTLLSSAFQRAKRRGWCRDVPTRDAELPKIDERVDTTPAVADVRKLVELAPPDFLLFLWLAVTTGARRGELCALRWSDLDVQGRVLRIGRAASYTPATGRVIGDVKTGPRGRKGIPLDRVDLVAFAAHRRQLRATAAEKKVYVDDCPWIFTNDFANCWLPNYATQRFIELRDAAGLPGVRLHDCRHFVATELIGGITDPRTAADHVGHSRAAMTLERYAKSIDQRRRDAATELRRRVTTGQGSHEV